MSTEYFAIGVILKPQGIKGELKIKPYTDSPERFNDFKKVLIKDSITNFYELNIEKRKYIKNWVIVGCEGIVTWEQAEALRGKTLWIHRSNAKKLAKDEFFTADIIGCKVVDFGGSLIGEVSQIISTGSNDVYVVSCGDKEIMLPALKKIIQNIDIQKKRIIIDANVLESLDYHEN